ncbi:MAG: oligosaccharide flippase family protein [Anaerovoracaceae bacterium]
MSISKLKVDVIVLVISNLVIGLIDFIFNIYCSQIFGPEGMGLISIVSPINCIFMSLITEGIVVTLSKIVAGQNYRNNQKDILVTLKISSISLFLWGSFIAFVLFSSAKFIANNFLGDSLLAYPIMAACPLIMLMSISNVFKGYFLGLNKIKIPAFINIGEKIFRYPILFLLIKLLLNRSSFPNITLVYICYSIGELFSVILLAVYCNYVKAKGIDYVIDRSVISANLKKIIKGALPLCLTNCLLDFTNAFSSILVKSRLISIGYSYNESLALLGKYKGMVFPLMAYPMIIIGSISSVIIPRMSTIISLGNEKYAKILIFKVLGIALLIGVFTSLVYFAFADQIGFFLYHRCDLTHMIRLTGLLAPLLYTANCTNSVLISMGKEHISFKNSFLQQTILLICLIIFTSIPSINIYGYIIALLISNIVLLSMNLHEIYMAFYR